MLVKYTERLIKNVTATNPESEKSVRADWHGHTQSTTDLTTGCTEQSFTWCVIFGLLSLISLGETSVS
jgi:hypothetical protein